MARLEAEAAAAADDASGRDYLRSSSSGDEEDVHVHPRVSITSSASSANASANGSGNAYAKAFANAHCNVSANASANASASASPSVLGAPSNPVASVPRESTAQTVDEGNPSEFTSLSHSSGLSVSSHNLSSLGDSSSGPDVPGSPGDPPPSLGSDSDLQSMTSSDDDEELDLDGVEKCLLHIQAKYGLSVAAVQKIIDVFQQNQETCFSAMRDGLFPSFLWMRRKHIRELPTSYVDVKCCNPNADHSSSDSDDEPQVEHSFLGRSTYPKKEIETSGLQPDSLRYYLRLESVLNFHRDLHGGEWDSEWVDLSIDGVPASRSGLHNFDYLTIQFVGCKNIYLMAVFEPCTRRNVLNGEAALLEEVLRDLPGCGLQLRYVVADAPKRAKLQGIVGHSGKYSCNLCVASKTRIRHEGKATYNFTSDSLDWPLRTLHMVEDALRDISDLGEADDSRVFGVRNESPLRALGDFNYIDRVIVEGMHLLYLGVFKRMLQMSFSQGAKPTGSVSFRRVSSKFLDEELLRMKTLTQFVRRIRRLDFAVWKATEYRNLLTAFWQAVVFTCPVETVRIWIKTVYITRLLLLPDSVLPALGTPLKDRLRDWFLSYQSTFGKHNMTYNTHMFMHADLIRRHGPLTRTSAMRFEDAYGDLKKCYKPGTPSMGFQLLNNALLRAQVGHRCRKAKFVGPRSTGRVDDSLLYLCCRKVVQLDNEDNAGWPKNATVIDLKLGYEELNGFDLNDVLIFEAKPDGEQSGDTHLIHGVEDVAGKCVRHEDVITVVTWNILQE